MKELDELKESVDSYDKAIARGHDARTDRVLLSDCLNGIVKVLVVLTTPEKAEKPSA